jgi:hypothetical protein
MGRYYGLMNRTQKTNVISYWKGSPPSSNEVKFAIIFFGWKRGDTIIGHYACKWDWDTMDWNEDRGDDEWENEVNEWNRDVDVDVDEFVDYNFPDKQYEKCIKMQHEDKNTEEIRCKVKKASKLELDELSKNIDKTFFCN